ncbi:acyltransferase [Lewinella sp. LCG006]|uniref:acyltransferase n=1 Tax=Lewinella sp. LCG006 TaxID=3231911 RepID=UPI00345FBCC9
MIHQLADVQTQHIGPDTTVWQFSIILEGAQIGNHCNINCHTFIENKVTIGNYVTVKSGVYLWDGLQVEDNVFIGPNATFTNDKRPRSKQYPSTFQKTIIRHHASIGAGATVLGGVTIGEYAIVGANSLVTKDIPPRSLVLGQPARIVGWINEDGSPMESLDVDLFQDNQGNTWKLIDSQIKRL